MNPYGHLGIDEAYNLIEEHATEVAKLRVHIAEVQERRELRAVGLTLNGLGLSEAERRVIAYVRSNLTNAEIARTLNLSLETIKTHLKRIYTKLGVSCRAEAAAVISGARPAGIAGGEY